VEVKRPPKKKNHVCDTHRILNRMPGGPKRVRVERTAGYSTRGVQADTPNSGIKGCEKRKGKNFYAKKGWAFRNPYLLHWDGLHTGCRTSHGPKHSPGNHDSGVMGQNIPVSIVLSILRGFRPNWVSSNFKIGPGIKEPGKELPFGEKAMVVKKSRKKGVFPKNT